MDFRLLQHLVVKNPLPVYRPQEGFRFVHEVLQGLFHR